MIIGAITFTVLIALLIQAISRIRITTVDASKIKNELRLGE